MENKVLYSICDKIVSVFRAIPFIILLAFIAPVTQAIVGTQIGTTAALVPLSIGFFAFYARQVQVALKSVDQGKIEAAQAIGSTNKDIIFDVYLRESRSELIRVSTVSLISLVSLTAMAGAIGAGGLGNTPFHTVTTVSTTTSLLVATLLVLLFVLIIQVIATYSPRS